MKKTLQLLALSSLLSLPAMATVFMSYEANSYIDKTTIQIGNSSEDFTQKELIIGIGGGDIDSYSYNIYIINQTLENQSDYSSGGLGINIRPYYTLSKNLHWYLDFGLTSTITIPNNLDFNDNEQDMTHLRTGIGISYILLDMLEWTFGYKYKYLIDSVNHNDTSFNSQLKENQTLSIDTASSSIYFGINLWFGNAHKESKILKKIKPIQINNRLKEEVF